MDWVRRFRNSVAEDLVFYYGSVCRHVAVERKEVDLFKILIFVTHMNQTQYGLGKTPVLTVTLI